MRCDFECFSPLSGTQWSGVRRTARKDSIKGFRSCVEYLWWQKSHLEIIRCGVDIIKG